jgi:hypothetical protein
LVAAVPVLHGLHAEPSDVQPGPELHSLALPIECEFKQFSRTHHDAFQMG